jgi:hypothetical protein
MRLPVQRGAATQRPGCPDAPSTAWTALREDLLARRSGIGGDDADDVDDRPLEGRAVITVSGTTGEHGQTHHDAPAGSAAPRPCPMSHNLFQNARPERRHQRLNHALRSATRACLVPGDRGHPGRAIPSGFGRQRRRAEPERERSSYGLSRCWLLVVRTSQGGAAPVEGRLLSGHAPAVGRGGDPGAADMSFEGQLNAAGTLRVRPLPGGCVSRPAGGGGRPRGRRNA